MSGRLDHFFVTEAVLDSVHYHQLVSGPSCGAVTSFIGSVRSPNKGQVVKHIDYEGYEAMILAQMRVVAGELREQYDLGGLAIAHRLGRLFPGEASIMIVVASKHRKDALAACQACIDRCKELLPVWKREVTETGEVWVEGSSIAGETL